MAIEDMISDVWEVELEILRVVDEVCRKHQLKYSLFYGTLLGAVRHGGFIPWDDDIDICMPRRDYDKFKKVWRKENPEGFVLQDYYGIGSECNNNNFMKVRKDHTTFLQFEVERSKTYHKGIFVDIFPMDRVPESNLLRKVQKAAIAVNLLYSREYTSGQGGFRCMAEAALLRVPKKYYKGIKLHSEKIMKAWNYKKTGYWTASGTWKDASRVYPEDLFENLEPIGFCGEEYLTVKNKAHVLTIQYGDYMQLPPEEDRVWKHHPLMIDFARNYEDIDDM